MDAISPCAEVVISLPMCPSSNNLFLNGATRQLSILQTCDRGKRAKLQQLGYLKSSTDIDKSMRREADRQYRALWREIEEEWFAQGKPS